eukprot:Mrub_03142.p1 GENE.Mrub_03142~~Mrub_03142.p1  ORF type:complete len:488 (-),score=88.94 Mrub_03142:61-1446(-)
MIQNTPIRDRYKLSNKVLGQGIYGSVVKATSYIDKNEVRACKIIPKSKVKNLKRLKEEINILKDLDHPNIVKLYEYNEDKKYSYLIMELLNGGELFDRITQNEFIEEAECRKMFGQIVRSVNYLHKRNIVHRDIKPENFMFVEKDSSDLKMIDLGLATNFNKHADKLSTKAGSPYYIAPETLNGSYDHTCDIWSLGVLLYIMLIGYPPFRGDRDEEVIKNVKKGKLEFPGEEWDEISDSAKDLLKKMINLNPKSRISAEKILEHEWLNPPKNLLKKQRTMTLESLDTEKRRFLKDYTNFSKFKKLMYQYLVMVSNDLEFNDLKDKFDKMDLNKDGILSKHELIEGLKNSGYKDIDEINEIYYNMDTNRNEQIEYTEFVTAMIDHSKFYLDENRIMKAFDYLDKDKSGYIERNEIVRMLGVDNEELIDYIFVTVDTDESGQITFAEFKDLMSSESLYDVRNG